MYNHCSSLVGILIVKFFFLFCTDDEKCFTFRFIAILSSSFFGDDSCGFVGGR